MSATSMYAVEGFEWYCEGQVVRHSKDDGELDWPPNPYQAQADAQVRAGAWPGASLLYIGSSGELCPWQQIDGTQHMPAGYLWPFEMGSEVCVFENVLQDVEDQSACTPTNTFENGFAGSFDNSCGSFDHSCGSFETSCGSFDNSCVSFDSSLVDTAYDSADDGNLDTTSHDSSGHSAENAGTELDNTPGRKDRKLSHQCVPKTTDFVKKFGDEIERDKILTLMIRNIPNMYTRSMLMEELDSLGFEGEYDFIYLPIDKSTQWNVGYAFVNFVSHWAAKRCVKVMTNYTFCRFEHGSGKVVQISVAYIQGLERNLEYYSNTAVQCARIQNHRPLAVYPSRQNETPRKANRRWRGMRAGESQSMHQRGPRGQRQTPSSYHTGKDNSHWEPSLNAYRSKSYKDRCSTA